MVIALSLAYELLVTGSLDCARRSYANRSASSFVEVGFVPTVCMRRSMASWRMESSPEVDMNT